MKINAWRIIQSRILHDAFTGVGARLHGGRWNHKGTPIIYTASTVSLAAMEMLINMQAPEVLKKYTCIPVHFDESLCAKVDDAGLPANWSSPIPRTETEAIGTGWAKNKVSAVLIVPSAVVPIEKNYLLNPLHPDFPKIKIGTPLKFLYDPRILKKT